MVESARTAVIVPVRYMPMRWSQMHIPTLREDPAEADAPSHRLLLRGGYVRQLMAGHYSLLPLAVRVRARVISIIREELDGIGGQELLLPAMHPGDVWKQSGRWDVMGDEMFRLHDRKGADLALGMTHEEVITTLARELSSYRQLPQIWYQFQTKFRDEPRPKAGLLRTREFTMKDSYSFDISGPALDKSFERHRRAYVRIFARLGLPAIGVQVSSGSMGGSTSMEFMSPAEAGEDVVVYCHACGYAANSEKATSKLAHVADKDSGSASPEQFPTPNVTTIEDLAKEFDAPHDRQVKTLVYVLDGQLTLVLVRGDHTVAPEKLRDATGARTMSLAEPDEIRAALGASPGSLGAVGSVAPPVIADSALRGRKNMFTGANVDGVHLRGVDVDRDIVVDRWADLREVMAGDACPRCEKALSLQRAIEVGHIFKLGDRYSTSFEAAVVDAEGARVPVVMGCYGIGIERTMAAIVETNHDESGIVWPMSVAPFEVAVVVAQIDDAESAAVGESIYKQLRSAGIDAVIDDRAERAGVKFRDVELVGIPIRVTVGRRGLSEGAVEIARRVDRETRMVALGGIVNEVRQAIASELGALLAAASSAES